MVPAAKHAVHPGEQDVTLPVAPDRGQRQNGHAAHEDGSLAQVLPGDAAFHRVPDDDQPERHAPHGPRQAHVHLQCESGVTETVFLSLVSLQKQTARSVTMYTLWEYERQLEMWAQYILPMFFYHLQHPLNSNFQMSNNLQ